MPFCPFVPASINSMTAAYNVVTTLRKMGRLPPETIIDIGANSSQMCCLLLALNKSAKVLSFEPNPTLNPIGTTFRIALSNKDGAARLVIPHNDTGWGKIEADACDAESGEIYYDVKTSRLESLVSSGVVSWKSLRGPIFVKIDTEGSEQRVIEGFGNYLSDVSYLLIEVENREDRGQNYNLVSLCNVLAKHGFDGCKIVYSCYDGPDAPAYSDVLFWRKQI